MIKKEHCLIIGAMKSGTTSLFYSLKDFPQIDTSFIKDTKFFLINESGGNWHKGIEWYKSQFSNDGLVNIEASTHYTKLPDYSGVPDKILKTLKNVKFIYLFRNPIDRAISHFFHNKIVDKETIEINTAFSDTSSKYYNYSDYSMQIIPYLRLFDRSNILFKNLVECKNIDLNEILSFITDQYVSNSINQTLQYRNSFEDLLSNKQNQIVKNVDILVPHKKDKKISLAKGIGLKRDVLKNMVSVMQEKYFEFSELIGIENNDLSINYEEYL